MRHQDLLHQEINVELNKLFVILVEHWVRMVDVKGVVIMLIVKRMVMMIMHELLVIIERIVMNDVTLIRITMRLNVFLELIFC